VGARAGGGIEDMTSVDSRCDLRAETRRDFQVAEVRAGKSGPRAEAEGGGLVAGVSRNDRRWPVDLIGIFQGRFLREL
jgi:hypothetical protein